MPIVNLLPSNRNLPDALPIATKPDHLGGQAYGYISGEYFVKIYKNSKADTKDRLKKVIQLGQNLGDDDRVLAWPLGMVDRCNGNPCAGCVSRYVPTPPHNLLLNLLYSPVDAVKQFQQGRSWVEFLKIARSTAGAIRAVHDRGIAPSDVSFNNVLADPQKGTAVVIDLDSAIVPGFIPPDVFGTPRFQAPELVMGSAKPSEKSDRYSLAVLLLWTLLFRNVMQPVDTACYAEDPVEDERLGWGKFACFSENPRERRHWFAKIGLPMYKRGALSYRCLTPKLQKLSDKAFIDGLHAPSERPTARDWEHALAEAYDVLVICPSCHQSFLYPFWLPLPQRQCPFCGNAWKPPYPAVVELLEAGAIKGGNLPVRMVCLYHGLPLFSDVIEPGRLPPFTRFGLPIIGQTAWNPKENEHRLINLGDTPWRILAGGSGAVTRGASVALRKGLLLSFGDGKRLARVVE